MPGFRRNLRTRRAVVLQSPSRIASIVAICSIIVIIICVIVLGIKNVQHKQEIAKKQEEINNIFISRMKNK